MSSAADAIGLWVACIFDLPCRRGWSCVPPAETGRGPARGLSGCSDVEEAIGIEKAWLAHHLGHSPETPWQATPAVALPQSAGAGSSRGS